MTLAWKVTELSKLNEIRRNLLCSIKVLLTKVDRQNSMTEENIASQLKVTRHKLVELGIQESRSLSVFQIRADTTYMYVQFESYESEENDYNDYTSMYVNFNLGAILLHTITFPLCFNLGLLLYCSVT